MSVEIEAIAARVLEALPGARVSIRTNPGPSAQHSLLVAGDSLLEVCAFLRDTPGLEFDFLSNVTGVESVARIERFMMALLVALAVVFVLDRAAKAPVKDDRWPGASGSFDRAATSRRSRGEGLTVVGPGAGGPDGNERQVQPR